MAIGNLNVGVIANTARANKNLKSFRGSLGKTAKQANLVSKSFKALSAGIAGFATVSFAKQAIQSFRNVADELTEASRAAKRLGVSVGELQKLEFAALSSGIEVDVLRDGMQELQLRVSEAARGSGQAADALKVLGLQAKSFQLLSADRKLGRIADELKRVRNAGDRIRLADELFGGEATKLLTVLDKGSLGLRQFGDEAERLGLVTNRNLDDVRKFSDAANKLDKALTGMSRELTITVAPAAVEYVTNLTRAVKLMRDQQEARRNGEGFFQSFKTAGDKMFGRALAEGMKNFTSKALGGDAGGTRLGMSVSAGDRTGEKERTRSPGFGGGLRAFNQKMAITEGLRSFGRELGRISNDVESGRLLKAAPTIAPMVPRGINALIDADSREGYMALRANMRGGSNQDSQHIQQTAKAAKSSDQSLSEIAKIQREFLSMCRNHTTRSI